MTTPKSNMRDKKPVHVQWLVETEPADPYNRFVEDGYGLIVDNSNVEEEIDFSPDEER